MTKKSLCVVTGTRAEYGLLRPVLQKLLQSAVIEPRLVVTGAHLAPEFGNTVSEIEADGMPIAARIPILKFGTGTPLATARTISLYDGALYRLFHPTPAGRGAGAGRPV